MGGVKCLACGADGYGEAVYPYDDGKIDRTEPAARLLAIEAQPTARGGPYKLLFLCHDCWHRLEGDDGPDMWTTQAAYEALGPVTPFAGLPVLRYARPDGTVGDHVPEAVPVWDPTFYLGDNRDTA